MATEDYYISRGEAAQQQYTAESNEKRATNNWTRQAEDQRDRFYIPFVRQIIYDRIIGVLYEAGQTITNKNAEVMERLRKELAVQYKGQKYYFVDAAAIESSVNQPNRFAGENNINLGKVIRGMSWESLSIMDPWNFSENPLVSWGLADDGTNIHTLNTLVSSAKYIYKQFNNQQLAFKTSGWTEYFVRPQLSGVDDASELGTFFGLGDKGYELIFIGKSDFESDLHSTDINLNPTGQLDGAFRRAVIDPIIDIIKAPMKFEKSVDEGLVHNYDLGDFPEVIRNIYETQLEFVLKEIRMDLVDEQRERNSFYGGGGRDVIRPEIAAPRPPPPPPKPVTKKINALKPSDAQCYLLQDIRALAGYKDGQTLKTPYKRMGIIYDNAATKGEPGNVISYIHHANRSREIDALLNLCPDVYALLTPYIKLYRVDYLNEDLLVPYQEQEIPFPNFIDPKDIEQITQGTYGRFPGAGIKSFSWNLDGVNPAEVSNNISAVLNLHFQTVQDLFSLNESFSAGLEQAGYLDLIIGSPTSFLDKPKDAPRANKRLPAISTACLEAESQSYKATNYRIKIVAGWSTPPDFANIVKKISANSTKDPDYAENLKTAIDNSRVALYLQNTTHELTFNENGTVDLLVNYQASLSGILRTPSADIFTGGTKYDEVIKKLGKELDKENDKISDIMKQQAGVDDASEIDYDNKEIQKINDRKEKILEELREIKNKSRSLKYRRFLDRLYDSGKIQWYNVPYENLTLLKDMTKEQKKKFYRSQQKNARSNSDRPSALDPSSADLEKIQKLTELQNFLTLNAGVDDNELTDATNASGAKITFGEARENTSRQLRELQRKKTKTGLRIPFFFLGDFLDEILHYLEGLVVDKDGANGSFQFLSSMVELIDPLLAFKVRTVDIRCPNNTDKILTRTLSEIDPMRFKGLSGLKFRTNIASIPISLEFFQEWFTNKVVRPQKEKFTFLNFIKSVSSSLIAQAFNSMCFEDGVNYNLRFDAIPFNFADSYTNKIVGVESLARSKAVADRKSLEPRLPPSPGQPARLDVIPSLVLYSVDSRPHTGLYDEDLENGIYHYYLGASCGLAKSITFERQNMPYYREARLQRTSALSAVQLRELYHANIELIGNTIHRNGQYLFINPIAIGAGSSVSKGDLPNYARLLGIGGYYMIIAVNHEISSAGFNVSVRTLQEGVDFSTLGNSTVTVVTIDGSSLPRPNTTYEGDVEVWSG